MKDSVVWLEVNKVHPNLYNPNVMSGEKFEALKDFCLTHGAEQLDPIWVRHDGVEKFEVVDGEHRWRAAKEVGWKRLRAFIIDLKEEDAKAFNVRKNRERGQINVFKLGRLFEAEKASGLTCAEIATKFGYLNEDGSPMHSMICEVIEIAEKEKTIKKSLGVGTPTRRISYHRARDILRELKREEQGESEKKALLTPKVKKALEILGKELPIQVFNPTDVVEKISEVEGQGQTKEESQTPETVEGTQNLEQFLTNYAQALKKNPLPKVEKDDVQTAIDFFKRLLKTKKVTCPVCGEQHLQWKCGHEF